MKYLAGTGIEIVDFSWSGHANQYLSPLRHSISAICRQGRGVSHYYIGIASGPDFDYALKRRMDSRKMLWGCRRIWNLYVSTSQERVRWLEEELVDYFSGDSRIQNSRGGGGGRSSSQPWHYLYLAFRKDTDPMHIRGIAQ